MKLVVVNGATQRWSHRKAKISQPVAPFIEKRTKQNPIKTSKPNHQIIKHMIMYMVTPLILELQRLYLTFFHLYKLIFYLHTLLWILKNWKYWYYVSWRHCSVKFFFTESWILKCFINSDIYHHNDIYSKIMSASQYFS